MGACRYKALFPLYSNVFEASLLGALNRFSPQEPPGLAAKPFKEMIGTTCEPHHAPHPPPAFSRNRFIFRREVVKENLAGAQSLGIWLPIIIAMSLKIAQGSGTVSIITTASLMAPLVPSLGMDSPSARALVVVAIGAGSMIASHANDSYFWVVTQMSNMTVNQGYRLQTIGTLILGICTSLVVYVMSLWIL